MDKNSFFWLGGIGSFGFYTAVIALLIFTLSTKDNLKKIAIKSEQSSIEVSFEDLSSEALESASKPVFIQKEKSVEELPKRPEPKKIEKIVEEALSPKKNIKDVTKKESPKQQMVEPIQQKTASTQEPKSAKDLLAALSIKKNSDVSFVSFNTSGETNEYLSNIAKIIKQGWSPAKSDVGLIAVVAVNIEADGSFSFRIKRGGGGDFGDRLSAYMAYLQKQGFPPPTDRKPISVEFNFKARE